MAAGEILPVPDRRLVFEHLRQRCCTRREPLSDGRPSTIYGSDDDAADQGERQPGIREGNDDPDPTIPEGVARAQLWSYAVLLEVLRNSLALRAISNSQIFRLTLIF